jgi:hypothetical protein
MIRFPGRFAEGYESLDHFCGGLTEIEQCVCAADVSRVGESAEHQAQRRRRPNYGLLGGD